jgi:hypothetical protein
VDGENWVEFVWPGVFPLFKARQQEAVLFAQCSSLGTQGQLYPQIKTTHSHSRTSHKIHCNNSAGYTELFRHSVSLIGGAD